MSGGMVTILLFGSLMVLLASGLPLAFSLGGIGAIYCFIFLGPEMLYLSALKTWSIINNFSFLVIPLFILMASILQRSGIAGSLYKIIHLWMGGLKGGLAAGSVIVAALIGAMAGVSGAATVSLGIIALPAMLSANYDKKLVSGCVQAGGALGILIPPSITMIIFAIFSEISIGKLFMAGILPGILLSGLFIYYILIRCQMNPSLGPALAPEERANFRQKVYSLRAVILPIIIIIGVLGSIYSGIATPTESAAVGVFMCLFAASVHKNVRPSLLKEASLDAFRLTSMIMWILLGSYLFTAVYHSLGVDQTIREILLASPGGKWGCLVVMQLTFFILGMFLDPGGIIMITAPLFVPIAAELGFDLIWYGILFVINMEMGYLTPPFGFNLFYMRSIAPESITMSDIYNSVYPFVIIQAIGIIIIALAPDIALWLPGLMKY